MVAQARPIVRSVALSWLASSPSVREVARQRVETPGKALPDALLENPALLVDALTEAVVEAVRSDAPPGVVEGLLQAKRAMAARFARFDRAGFVAGQVRGMQGLRDPYEIKTALEEGLRQAPDEESRRQLQRLMAVADHAPVFLGPDGVDPAVFRPGHVDIDRLPTGPDLGITFPDTGTTDPGTTDPGTTDPGIGPTDPGTDPGSRGGRPGVEQAFADAGAQIGARVGIELGIEGGAEAGAAIGADYAVALGSQGGSIAGAGPGSGPSASSAFWGAVGAVVGMALGGPVGAGIGQGIGEAFGSTGPGTAIAQFVGEIVSPILDEIGDALGVVAACILCGPACIICVLAAETPGP